MTSKQIIQELEHECRKMSNVKLEFFEPPAVPGFGAAGGFSAACLGQDEHDELQAARRSDRKVHGGLGETQGGEGPVHLLCQQLPAVRTGHQQRRGHAEGRVDRKMRWTTSPSSSAAPGSKASSASTSSTRSLSRPCPSSGGIPEDFENMFVKNDKGEMVPYSSFMTLKKQQGLNEINRYNLYPSAAIQACTGSRLQQRSSHQGDPGGRRRDAAARLRPRLGRPLLRRGEQREPGHLHLPDRRRLRLSGAGRAIRELHPAAGRDPVAAGRDLRILPVPAGHGVGQRRLLPRLVWSCWSVCWARTRF